MIYVEILAGGKETRMGNTELPKQFLKIGGKPIFIHTIEAFLNSNMIDKIILCTPKVWLEYAGDEINKYLGDDNNISLVEGGATRQDTVLNGCKYIVDQYGLNDDDIIITHDAVRPFINKRIIEENIEYTKKYGAVDTVVSATDTIVESQDHEFISNIPVRNNMYQGQTPQSFNLKELLDVLTSLSDEEKNVLTDACKAFVIKGKKVHLVEGETTNIKVTTPFDLTLSEAILKEINN